MTLHILKRRAELHFAQEVRQLKKQFVRYDQKSVDTTVSKRVCVCACVRVCVCVCVCVCVMLQRCELKGAIIQPALSVIPDCTSRGQCLLKSRKHKRIFHTLCALSILSLLVVSTLCSQWPQHLTSTSWSALNNLNLQRNWK